jgi:hypothetical protein
MSSKRLLLKFSQYHIVILIFLSIAAIFGTLKYQFLPEIQFTILGSLILVYLLWAFVYHKLDKTLNLEIMLEYILTALLALVILYGLLI